jgi:hypothetical protein
VLEKWRILKRVVDDWQNGYPLMNALGDEPDEWLDERGDRVARLDRGT